MKIRTKLASRVLPAYTRAEEIFHMTSHIIGGVLGVIATILCVSFALLHDNGYGIVSGAIYGATLIILYTMSSIYHGLKPERQAKKVFQVLDHCSVFLLIAGTYTPIALVGLRSVDVALSWWIFGIVWGAALLGIALNAIDLKKFNKFSMVCYLAMGWSIVAKADALPQFLPLAGLLLLIIGGLFYTVGTIFYGLGKKRRWAHSVFHGFIVVGSVLHFLCVLLYLM